MGKANHELTTLRWFQGLLLSAIFSLAYVISPVYILTSLAAILLQFPTRTASFLYGAPLLISILIPAKGAPWLADYMRPLLDYFDYEEVLEISNQELQKLCNTNTSDKKNDKGGTGGGNTKFIMALQPHGVISYTSMCCWVAAPPAFRSIRTAVASALLQTPILKNVMGIFHLTSASGENVKSILRNGQGVDGCIVLYVGGLAELFKSSRKEERLYLKKRKGFIKIALKEKNVDIIPVYLFGNTSVLTVVKTGVLAYLSRKFQVSLTYFWGKWFLPIPRDDKLIYARGKPLGLPYILEPTNEEVDEWHEKYCQEVTRLFNSYKEKLPAYKHKQLIIE
mmetsp:Transcript_35535/g.42418  ORF Transcript_35535/g.42418 Transcript_35535/m.42418 type:complete len:337 (-) Transcript_35535:89-1099(-)